MKQDIQKLLNEFETLYPDAKPALIYRTPYELLVAVILSAQCTDERVNKVTKVLFEERVNSLKNIYFHAGFTATSPRIYFRLRRIYLQNTAVKCLPPSKNLKPLRELVKKPQTLCMLWLSAEMQ